MPSRLRGLLAPDRIPCLEIMVLAVAWPAAQLSWGRVALLLAALVLVPLTLRAAQPRNSPSWGVLGVVRFPAALLLVLAHLLPTGEVAAALAGPWAFASLLLTRLGWSHLRRRRFAGPAAEWAIAGALLYQIVGGGWIVVERAGLRPYGLDEGLVLLSAIHTHLATLVLPMLLGLAGRHLPGRLTTMATIATLTAFPLVAVGVLAAPRLEWWGGWLLAAAGIATAVQQLRLAKRTHILPATRMLLAVSAAAFLGAMSLGTWFAGAPPLGWTMIDRATMLHWHGGLAAVAACTGLAAWAWAPPLPRSAQRG